ncbi:hypothetical protein Tco_0099344 [Tanacetum coccineum]
MSIFRRRLNSLNASHKGVSKSNRFPSIMKISGALSISFRSSSSLISSSSLWSERWWNFRMNFSTMLSQLSSWIWRMKISWIRRIGNWSNSFSCEVYYTDGGGAGGAGSGAGAGGAGADGAGAGGAGPAAPEITRKGIRLNFATANFQGPCIDLVNEGLLPWVNELANEEWVKEMWWTEGDNRRNYNHRQNQKKANAGAMTNAALNDNEVCPRCKNKKHAGDCWKSIAIFVITRGKQMSLLML